jgi:hypothetical protein
MSAAVANFGLTAGWQSDPIDCRGQVAISLELSCLLAASPAMLLVPSATAGSGILYVADLPGSAGDNIQITHSAPLAAGSPTLHSVTTTSNSIVIAPNSTDTNASIAALVNNDAKAGALVTAYPWGWTAYGDSNWVPQNAPTEASEIDLVKALAITNLVGGCDNASGAGLVPCSQSAVVTLYGSTSINPMGFDLNNPLVSGNLVAGVTNTLTLNASYPPRWVVARLVPNAGSFGNVVGSWFGRAAS